MHLIGKWLCKIKLHKWTYWNEYVSCFAHEDNHKYKVCLRCGIGEIEAQSK